MKKQTIELKKGFTLIELLIVIGILAVLATITILVLNPAQLFAQGRDSQRISDLATTRDAISLYLATVSSPDLAATGANCLDEATPRYWTTLSGSGESYSGTPTAHANHGREIDGTGWVPIDFTTVSGGSPLATLPIDPTNEGAFFYTYACDDGSTTFELNANMESDRYQNGGPDDVESTDGGPSSSPDVNVYEVGTDPDLDL